MDPVNSPYEKRVDAKHDVLQIYTHVHQNVSRSHDEIGTLHAPTQAGATTLIASSGWQIQSQQRGRRLLSQALGNRLFSLVTLFLVIAIGSRFFSGPDSHGLHPHIPQSRGRLSPSCNQIPEAA